MFYMVFNGVLYYYRLAGCILRNGVIKSIGNGKMIVEFFSLEILLSVCKYLNCNAAGLSLNVSAASFNALDAFISPSAAITLARASLV
jgi:hypothetical protein